MSKFALPVLLALAASTSLPLFCIAAETGTIAGRSKAEEDAQANLRFTAEELDKMKSQVESDPSDAKLRYTYAEALKKTGRNKEAAREYLGVTELEPTYYHAYHQLSLCTNEKTLLGEGIARLNYLKAERPKDLMLRVGLSELYEKTGEFYQASRVLVDIIYLNAVPDKYLGKINNRIRYLQSKVKDYQALDKNTLGEATEDAGPAPLPDANLSRDLSISKVKEPRVMQGFGNAPLLP